MEQLEGFIHKLQKRLVCLLLKFIYGLKQAPRMWNEHVSSFLIDLGFVKSIKDSTS
jgi:hypothetical protein